MKNKYTDYNLEDLIEDRQFVSWVLNGKKEIDWEKIIKSNTEFKSKALKAKEIILLLRDTYEVLDEETVLEIWHNIDDFELQNKKKGQNFKFKNFISWAAIFLFILSSGFIGFHYFQDHLRYKFVSTEHQPMGSEARLILSDGEEIKLNSDDSKISINKGNELRIDSNSIIDLSQKQSESEESYQMNEVIIPYGKKSELLLSDGTKVWLNAGSRFAFPTKFTTDSREVFLEGEACFKVTKNRKHPFIVKAGQLDIKVLGTYFNVSAYPTDNSIETVLLEGSVSIGKPKLLGLGKSVTTLQPNQKATFDKQNKSVEISNEPYAELYIAWTEGWLQFSKESLHSVFNKLERYYNIDVIIPLNFPPSEIITGKLDLKESLEDVMVALSGVADIEYRIAGNKIYIDRKIKELKKRK